MKRIILLASMMLTAVSAIAQMISIEESFRQMGWDITPLPHAHQRYGNPEPHRCVYFHLPYWAGQINNDNLWSDWQLSQPMGNPYLEEGIGRRFTPSNGNYMLGVITIGDKELGIDMLVTATPEGEFIDAIQTAFAFAQSDRVEGFYLRQWKVSADMKATVYWIRPTPTEPSLSIRRCRRISQAPA